MSYHNMLNKDTETTMVWWRICTRW